MPTPFWRAPDISRQFQRLDRAGFALEFLRRNPDYRRGRNRALRLIAGRRLTERDHRAEIGKRWGLSFRP